MFDLEKYLTELKNEQMKKLEALNGNVGDNTTGTNTCSHDTSTDTKTKNKDSATSSFKFPISYLENKQEINENIINDLEVFCTNKGIVKY